MAQTVLEQNSPLDKQKTPISYSKLTTEDTEDLDLSDVDYDDENDEIIENKLDKQKSNASADDLDETIKCELCQWLKKYAKAIGFAILFLIIYLALFLFVVDDDSPTFDLVVEFMFLWFLSISLCRLIVHLLLYGWTVYKARKLQWIDKFEAIQNIYFYIEYSKQYMRASVVSILAFAILTSLLTMELYHDVASFKISEDDYYTFKDFMLRATICFILLFTALWAKQIFVRWWIIESYLQPHIETVNKMKQYESWIKILLNTKHIFSIKVKTFLNVHGFGHSRSKKLTVFRVAILLEQNELNLKISSSPSLQQKMHSLSAIDETIKAFLNTKNMKVATDKYSHTVETCLLWLYSPKKKEATFMDDTELHKLCKIFAKYVINHIEDDAELKSSISVPKMGITEIFKSIIPNKMDEEKKNNVKTDSSSDFMHSESNLSLTDGIRQEQFMKHFVQRDKRSSGLKAWKKIHFNANNEILTRKEMSSWLFSYLRRLIYLRQCLDSYHSILSNMQNAASVLVLFLLLFVCLLIFAFDFTESVSIFFSFTAICAVFGQSTFVQYFDGFCFVFVVAPYSIGDVILIDNNRFIIKEINVLSTVMLDEHNHVTFENNSFLLKKNIQNLTLTKYSRHILTFYLSQLTTTHQLTKLKHQIEKFVSTKMSNDINDIWFILDGIDMECRMKIRLIVSSFYSFSNKYIMFQQYHLIQMQVHKVIMDLGIEYRRFSNQDIQICSSLQE